MELGRLGAVVTFLFFDKYRDQDNLLEKEGFLLLSLTVSEGKKSVKTGTALQQEVGTES